MKLKDKITNKEDLVIALKNDPNANSFESYKRILTLSHGVEPAWWAVREYARIDLDIYQVTEALEKVNNHAKVFAHVSMTDKTKVAFTPDKSFGERDAQLMMNFGKMVQRVIPFASDDYVKKLTEDHYADLSDEVEWITGVEIANVYANTKVSSCMTNKVWEYVNPTLAYDAPGIKMAVLRDSGGTINARCMVYEDGDDKRLIRNHGDERLRKRLTRLGYKPGGWQGVKFRTIIEPIKGADRVDVVIPYLDAMNGPSQASECTVILLDGVLRGVKKETFETLKNVGVNTAVPHQVGYVCLKPTSSASYDKKDIVTGEDLNLLTDDVLSVLYQGTEGVAKRANVEDFIVAKKIVDGLWKTLYMPKNETFEHGYSRFFDGTKERECYGYFKLSKEYYEMGDWFKGSVARVETNGVTQFIRQSDAVRLYDGKQRNYLHYSKVDKKLHTRVADCDGQKHYVTSNVEVLRTPSKAKVVERIHEIKLGWNGWDYSRNLQVRRQVFGSSVYCRRPEATTPEFKEYLESFAKQKIENFVSENQGRSLQDLFVDGARRQGGMGYIYPNAENKYSKRNIYGVGDVLGMDMNTFKEFVEDFARYTSNDTAHKMLVQWARTAIAEMEAVNGEEPAKATPTLDTPELVMADRFALAA